MNLHHQGAAALGQPSLDMTDDLMIMERSVEDEQASIVHFKSGTTAAPFNKGSWHNRDNNLSGGKSLSIVMDSGLDLLNRVQMFQIAVNKISNKGFAEKKKGGESVFKMGGVNANATASKYFDQAE